MTTQIRQQPVGGPGGLNENEATRKRNRYLQVVVFVSTLGGLLFGFDTGNINGALNYMVQDLGLTPTTEGVVTSSLVLGAAFGAMFGGRLADGIGRRTTIIVVSCVFMVATIGCSLAPTVFVLVPFRILLGLGVGAASVTVPTYLSEISPAARRGRLTTRNELMIVIGQLLAYTINALIATLMNGAHIWRWMIGVAVIPAVALLVGMLFMPESPRWLMSKERDDQAWAVLRRTRSEETCVYDVEQIRANLAAENEAEKGSYRDLLLPWVLPIMGLGTILAFAQQATGVNSIMYYGTQVLAKAGLGTSGALVANIGNGIMAVISVSVGLYLFGILRRRVMIITSLVGVMLALIGMAAFYQFLPDSQSRAWCVLGAMMVYVLFIQGGVCSTTWLLLSEIFPQRIRGLAFGIITFLTWVLNFLMTLFFPIMSTDGALGLPGTYLLFAVVALVVALLLRRFLPETSDKSLEQIEAYWRAKHPVRA